MIKPFAVAAAGAGTEENGLAAGSVRRRQWLGPSLLRLLREHEPVPLGGLLGPRTGHRPPRVGGRPERRLRGRDETARRLWERDRQKRW